MNRGVLIIQPAARWASLDPRRVWSRSLSVVVEADRCPAGHGIAVQIQSSVCGIPSKEPMLGHSKLVAIRSLEASDQKRLSGFVVAALSEQPLVSAPLQTF